MAAMTAAAIAATTASVASMGTGIAGAAMAGGDSGQRYKLTPEQEMQFIKATQRQLYQIETDYKRVAELEKEYRNKMKTVEGVIQGTIPEAAAIKELTASAGRIAKIAGLGPEEAAKQGLISQDELASLTEYEKAAGQDFEDLTLKNQLADERMRLEQNLRRAGVSPEQISRELGEFDRQSMAMMQSRSEELKTASLARQTTARGQWFGELGARQGIVGGELERVREGAGLLGTVAQNVAQMGGEALQLQSGLRGEESELYKTMGSFDYSKTAKQAMEAGLVGPGTVGEQTGVARRVLGDYKGSVASAERVLSRNELGFGGSSPYENAVWDQRVAESREKLAKYKKLGFYGRA